MQGTKSTLCSTSSLVCLLSYIAVFPFRKRGDQASDFIYSGIPQTAHLLQHTSGLMGEASRGAAGRRAEALLGRILVSSFATALYLNPKGLSDVVPNHS